MGRYLVFVIFLPFVFSVWDAHTYWNGRYAANGIDYTEGMSWEYNEIDIIVYMAKKNKKQNCFRKNNTEKNINIAHQ